MIGLLGRMLRRWGSSLDAQKAAKNAQKLSRILGETVEVERENVYRLAACFLEVIKHHDEIYARIAPRHAPGEWSGLRSFLYFVTGRAVEIQTLTQLAEAMREHREAISEALAKGRHDEVRRQAGRVAHRFDG